MSPQSAIRTTLTMRRVALLVAVAFCSIIAASFSAPRVAAQTFDAAALAQAKRLFYRLKADEYNITLRFTATDSDPRLSPQLWYTRGEMNVFVRNYDAAAVLFTDFTTNVTTNVMGNIHTLPFNPSVENSFDFLARNLAHDTIYESDYGFPIDARVAITTNTTIKFAFSAIASVVANKERVGFQKLYDAAWKLWRDNGYTEYMYKTRVTCFCPESMMTERIVSVSHGTVVSVRLASNDEPVSTSGYLSISTLFTEIQWAIDSAYIPSFRVSYDTALGYPNSYSFIIGRLEITDVPSYKIYGLQPHVYNPGKGPNKLVVAGIVVGLLALGLVIGVSIYLHRKSLRQGGSGDGSTPGIGGAKTGGQRASYYLSGHNTVGKDDGGSRDRASANNGNYSASDDDDDDTVIDHGEEAEGHSDSFEFNNNNNPNEIEMRHRV